MSRILLAYRFTGENHKKLEFLLGNIKSCLESTGHIVTCSFYFEDFYKKNNYSAEQIYQYMLNKQKESDVFMAFVKSNKFSEGMHRESNKAIELNQRYVLLMKNGLKMPEFTSAAHEIIRYSSYSKLFEKLRNFK